MRVLISGSSTKSRVFSIDSSSNHPTGQGDTYIRTACKTHTPFNHTRSEMWMQKVKNIQRMSWVSNYKLHYQSLRWWIICSSPWSCSSSWKRGYSTSSYALQGERAERKWREREGKYDTCSLLSVCSRHSSSAASTASLPLSCLPSIHYIHTHHCSIYKRTQTHTQTRTHA